MLLLRAPSEARGVAMTLGLLHLRPPRWKDSRNDTGFVILKYYFYYPVLLTRRPTCRQIYQH